MGTMKIRCDYCGGSWEVYSRDRGERVRICPHCGEKIPIEFWEGRVLPAYETFEKVNDDLYSDHVNKHYPLFQIEYAPDNIFVSRWKEAP